MFSKSSLEMLDAVARLGSFTAAAEVLHKVPSAISYSVRQIESELGVVLFRRLPRKVELTPAGELFMLEARQLLRQMEEIRAQTKRAAHGWRKTLKVTLDNVVKLDKMKPMVEASIKPLISPSYRSTWKCSTARGKRLHKAAPIL